MPTFEEIDNYWAGGAKPSYLNNNPSTPATQAPNVTTPSVPNLATTATSTSPSSFDNNKNWWTTVPTNTGTLIQGDVVKPVLPQSTVAPTYNSTLGNMYTKSFTDPNSMWNEYSQGQGVDFSQGAARAMAKAGHTGMLPTLNTLAHQDYMSNYLPSVRKDLQAGLNYENTANQNLTQKYGQELDFNRGIYGTDVTKYGQELGYNKDIAAVAAQVQDINVKQQLGMLDADLKMYGIDNETIQQIYATMGNIFPKMTAADQAAMVNELYLALGINKAGDVALADTVTGNSNSEYTDPTLDPNWSSQNG